MLEPRYYMMLYYVVLLLFTIYYALKYNIHNEFQNKKVSSIYVFSLFFFITFRPITDKFGFGDTEVYARHFSFAQGMPINLEAKDLGFEVIQHFCSSYDIVVFFGIFAILYLIPQYYSCRKMFPDKYAVAFFILISSFSFMGYGVNGIRNGAAVSLVMLGMTCGSIPFKIICFLIGASIHKSVLLPILGYIIALFYNQPKHYLVVWGCVLVLSLFFASSLSSILMEIDFVNDDRLSGYVNGSFEDMNTAMRTGFRFDFLAYSIIPMYIGYKYLKSNEDKKTNEDKIYNSLYCTYVIANAFWLLTVYVPYNNRFAYLSWFLYPLLVSYPYLRNNQTLSRTPVTTINIKRLIIINFLFTYLMWLR